MSSAVERIGYDARVTHAPEPGLQTRLLFGHGAAQVVAAERGVRLLHIKGVALDPALREGRFSTDVDVLVAPAGLTALQQGLVAAGWRLTMGFEAGSPFAHAETYEHRHWGHLDLHRAFPGVGLQPAEAFDLLWADGHDVQLAATTCRVPSLAAQRLILLLHAARSVGGGRGGQDVAVAWGLTTPAQRAEVTRLAARLDAGLALAAALGDLDDHKDARGYRLWRAVSRGGTRFEEWLGRIEAAEGAQERLRLVLRAPLVNVAHLAAVLGRQPTRAEIVREFFARPVRGLREQWPLRRGARL